MGRAGRALTAAVLLAIVAVALVFGLKSNKQPAQGRIAPALPTERLAGAPVTLQSLLGGTHGRPALVVFWASWCDPCTSEAPAIEDFSRTPEGRGRVVGVDWSDARSAALGFVHRFGWSFPVLRDAEGTVGNRYRLINLPTTFVLDSAGRIRMTLRGPQTAATLGTALRAVERL